MEYVCVICDRIVYVFNGATEIICLTCQEVVEHDDAEREGARSLLRDEHEKGRAVDLNGIWGD